MAAEVIGKGKCPLCGSEKATVSLTKKNLACLTCGACSCQVFARSERSDEKLRALIIGAAKPPAELEKKPDEKPAPKPDAKPAAKPAAVTGKADDWAPF